MDGYQKVEDIKKLLADEIKINEELTKLTEDLSSLKKAPRDMESWIDQLSDIDKNDNFKLSDFSKMFKVTRKYNNLVERQETNGRKIRIACIDEMLAKIKIALGEQ